VEDDRRRNNDNKNAGEPAPPSKLCLSLSLFIYLSTNNTRLTIADPAACARSIRDAPARASAQSLFGHFGV